MIQHGDCCFICTISAGQHQKTKFSLSYPFSDLKPVALFSLIYIFQSTPKAKHKYTIRLYLVNGVGTLFKASSISLVPYNPP